MYNQPQNCSVNTILPPYASKAIPFGRGGGGRKGVTGRGRPCLKNLECIGNNMMPAEEDIVERLRRRAARARDRYPDEADDPATLVGGLIQDYEAAADEIQRMRDALKDLSREALRVMLG